MPAAHPETAPIPASLPQEPARRYRRIRLSHRERTAELRRLLDDMCHEIPVVQVRFLPEAREIVVNYDLRDIRLVDIEGWLERHGITLDHSWSGDRLREAIFRTENRCRDVRGCCGGPLLGQG